jgi:hypothetical protein
LRLRDENKFWGEYKTKLGLKRFTIKLSKVTEDLFSGNTNISQHLA